MKKKRSTASPVSRLPSPVPLKRGRGACPGLRSGGAPVTLSRYGTREGICLGCGKKTTYRGQQLHQDSINWHTRCYQRLYRRKLRGSFTPREKTCVVCGKAFVALGRGHARKMCSQACAKIQENKKRYRGVKFSQFFPEGVCLGCGGRTFNRRKKGGRGKRDSINWHGLCYHRLRARPAPVRQKLIAIHREFAAWLAAWKEKNTSTRSGSGHRGSGGPGG